MNQPDLTLHWSNFDRTEPACAISRPPFARVSVLALTEIEAVATGARFGSDLAKTCLEQFKVQRFDRKIVYMLNRKLAESSAEPTKELRPLMLPFDGIENSLRQDAALTTAAKPGRPATFWQNTIRYARFTRDRFTLLDIAGDAGGPAAFARSCG